MSDLWKLPNTWCWATMGDVAEVVGGGTPPTKDSSNFGGEIPWVTPSDLSGYNQKFIVRGARNITETGFQNSGARWLPEGAVLFSSRAPIGYVAIASNPLTTNQGFKSYVPFEGVSSDYVYHWLTSAKQYAESLASGTTFLEISGAKAALVPFPIAPTAEQIRIVKKLEELLSSLDAGVAELKMAQFKLSQYRQTLLKEALEGKLTVEWRKKNHSIDESGSQLLERILSERRRRWEKRQLARFAEEGKKPPRGWQKKYPEPVQPDTTDLPQLPRGWVWASLDMLGDITSGVAKGTKRSSEIALREVPYLRVANVQRGYLDLTELKTILASERDIAALSLQNGDILFNEGGDRDKLGRGWVWRNEIAECIHQNHVFRMRPFLSEQQSELISHHGNIFGKQWFQNAGKQTTNLASINMTVLRTFPIPVASAEEQVEILSQIRTQLETILQQERAIELSLKQSSAQRQNILRAAFSGQLVPKDPNDEPANVLLENIREKRAFQTKTAPKEKKVRTSKMPSSKAITLIEWIASQTEPDFSFENIRNAVAGDYEQIKSELFGLLSDEKPIVEQYFDSYYGQIRFRSLKK